MQYIIQMIRILKFSGETDIQQVILESKCFPQGGNYCATQTYRTGGIMLDIQKRMPSFLQGKINLNRLSKGRKSQRRKR